MEQVVGGQYGLLMDIMIETLCGTMFRLRVSPFETVISIKAKLQRLEGISISQQHLIWQGRELEDDCCLYDYDIYNGARIVLVLGMRGGPVNTRRVSLLDPADSPIRDNELFDEMEEPITMSRCSLSPESRSHLTLLVFREGDQLNFYRIVDQPPDGVDTSPLSMDSPPLMKGSPMSQLAADVDMALATKSISKTKLNEADQKTHDKLRALISRIEQSKLTKKGAGSASNETKSLPNVVVDKIKSAEHSREERVKENSKTPDTSLPVPRPPSLNRMKSKSSHRRLRFAETPEQVETTEKSAAVITDEDRPLTAIDEQKQFTLTTKASNPSSSKPTTIPANYTTGDMQANLKEDLNPAVPDTSSPTVAQTDVGSSPSPGVCIQTVTTAEAYDMLLNGCTSPTCGGAPSRQGGGAGHSRLGRFGYPPAPPQVERFNTSSRLALRSRFGSSRAGEPDTGLGVQKVTTQVQRLKINSEVPLSYGTSDLSHRRPPSKNGMLPSLAAGAVSPAGTGIASLSLHQPQTKHPEKSDRQKTPPGGVKPVEQPAVAALNRCAFCRKKLGLIGGFKCRCGSTFCMSHRYAEEHNCAFDYKTDAKKTLRLANPLVTAAKLPKI